MQRYLRTLTPLQAIVFSGLIALFVTIVACVNANDKGATFIAGVGAFGQVAIAILLYFLTRDQFSHAKSEAESRRVLEGLAKRENLLADMTRMQAAFAASKTGIGKTRIDEGQIKKLESLQVDMKALFDQPASKDFNKMISSAKGAYQIGVNGEGYLEKISTYDECQSRVYREMKRKADELRQEIEAASVHVS